jgi:hypothetical protein
MLKSLRWISLGTWLALLAVAFLTSPPSDPNTLELVKGILVGKVAGVNTSFLALFAVMGVWPLIFIVLLAFDSTEQRVWRWPFVLGSFALGSFALLPYLVLRRWGAPRRDPNFRWLRVLGSRWLALVLTLEAAGLLAVFFLGEHAAFAQRFHRDQFTYVMCFDFLACTVAGVLLTLEDVFLRPTSPSWAWALLSAVGVPLRLVFAPLSKPARREMKEHEF